MMKQNQLHQPLFGIMTMMLLAMLFYTQQARAVSAAPVSGAAYTDVKSVYSRSYGDENVTSGSQYTWNNNSSISRESNSDESGRHLWTITTQNSGEWNSSAGFSFANVDYLSGYYIHVSVYNAQDHNIQLQLRLVTPGNKVNYADWQVNSPIATLTPGWNDVAYHASEFSYYGNSNENFSWDLVNEIGFIFPESGPQTVYIDNVYFYLPSSPAPNTSATNYYPLYINSGENGFVGDASPRESDDWAGETSATYGNAAWKMNVNQYRVPNYTQFNATTKGVDRLHVDAYYISGDKGAYVYPRNAYNGDESSVKTTLNWTNGQWVSIEIDLTSAAMQAYNGDLFQELAVLSDNYTTLLLDNIYFYSSTESTPSGGDATSDHLYYSDEGAKCYVKEGADAFPFISWGEVESQNPAASGHDVKDNTFLGISYQYLNRTDVGDEGYIVVALTEPITVSDVELVWGNGYPQQYDIKAVQSIAEMNYEQVVAAYNSGALLYSTNNYQPKLDPEYVTVSELDKVSGNSDIKYIILHLYHRNAANTRIGYKLCEVHVASYDEDYYTVDHLAFDDPGDAKTDETHATTVNVTPRNARNAILTLPASDITDVTLTPASVVVSAKKAAGDNAFTVASTGVGEYAVTVDGYYQGRKVNSHDSHITFVRDWFITGKRTSIVQRTDAGMNVIVTDDDKANKFSASSMEDANSSAWKGGDGMLMGEGDGNNRWSSFVDWGAGDVGNNFNKNNTAYDDEWWMVDLGNTYHLTDMEIVWERAYPSAYSVYGFSSIPTLTPSNSGDDATSKRQRTWTLSTGDATTLADHLLYTYSPASGIVQFPWHDGHTSTDNGGDMATGVNTRYLLVKMNNRVAQPNGDYYGYSIWEVYAAGNLSDANTAVDRLSTDNVIMKVKSEKKDLAFTAYYSADPTIEIENFSGIEFTMDDTYYTRTVTQETNPRTGSTITIYGFADKTSGEKLFDIYYNTDGTYTVKTYTRGYEKLNSINASTPHVYAVNVQAKNANDGDMTGSFLLYIYKEPMQLVSNNGGELVFDDGFFAQSVINAAADESVTAINLKQVDFSSDDQGNSLEHASLTAPRLISGMNPNAIYYVPMDEIDDATGKRYVGDAVDGREGFFKAATGQLSGENIAYVSQTTDDGNNTVRKYFFYDLRIYDGYDYAPLTDYSSEALHARFYTNVPKDKKSVIVLPFAPSVEDFDYYTDKGMKLYRFANSITFSEGKGAIGISELSRNDVDASFYGKPIVIACSTDQMTMGSGKSGYKVTFHNLGYVNANSYGEGEDKNQTIAMNTAIEPVQVGAYTLQGSYVKQNIPGNDVYLYSPSQEQFLPASSDSFNYDSESDGYNEGTSSTHAGQDLRNVVLPFFAYLRGAAQQAQLFAFDINWENNGDVTSAIDAQPTVATYADIYTIDGICIEKNVNVQQVMKRLPKGIYVVNGKKVMK